MSRIGPSPQTTLVILLGASEWPLSTLKGSQAFARSASKVHDYFCNPHQFGLPSENWLDLFDKYQSNPDEVDQAIGGFLDKRISIMKQTGIPARDLLLYYIGHGVFAPGYDQAYHLAIRSTRDESLRASAIAMATLAETLKGKARRLRRLVILDCCFAAESFKYMQSAPDQAALPQAISAFEEKGTGSGNRIPETGTALLCSSGHKVPSLLLRDESGTMFSEALVRALALKKGHQPDKTHFSLYELKSSIEEALESITKGDAPRPEVHSPDQHDGDVASIPFFPFSNPCVGYEGTTRVTNVLSHSVGVITWALDELTGQSKKVIYNLVQANERLPILQKEKYRTFKPNQDAIELKLVENTTLAHQVDDLTKAEEIGTAHLILPPGLPAGYPIEMILEVNEQGRLHITAREPSSNKSIEATLQTQRGLTEEGVEHALKGAHPKLIS